MINFIESRDQKFSDIFIFFFEIAYNKAKYVSLDFRYYHCFEYLEKEYNNPFRLNGSIDKLIEEDIEDIIDNQGEEENEESSSNNNEIENIQMNLN